MSARPLPASIERAARIVAQEQDTVLGEYRARILDEDRRRRAGRTVTRLVDLVRTASAGIEKLAEHELRSFADDVVELFYFAGRQRDAAEVGLRFPIYDVKRSYDYNAALPWQGTAARRPEAPSARWSLLGRQIGFPIGVPASALTGSASQIVALAQSGYNVLTFKTVRSSAKSASEQPNWVVLPDQTAPLPLDVNRRIQAVVGSPDDWPHVDRGLISTANSFGVPSLQPEEWRPEVEEALRLIKADQMLILSVMGDSTDDSASRADVIEDWVRVARLGEATGAHAIELNLSCPNTLSSGNADGVLPPICEDRALAVEIVRSVRAALDPRTPLIGKLSYLEREPLQRLVEDIGEVLDAYAGINTLQMLVVNHDGQPTFGGRARAGISGVAIRDFAHEFVRDLAQIRIAAGLSFEIIGMGGVTDPRSFFDLYAAGASVVQAASGVFADPRLAAQCIEKLAEVLPSVPPLLDDGTRAAVERAIESVLKRGRVDRYTLAAQLPIPAAQTFEQLSAMVQQREVFEDIERSGESLYSLAD